MTRRLSPALAMLVAGRSSARSHDPHGPPTRRGAGRFGSCLRATSTTWIRRSRIWIGLRIKYYDTDELNRRILVPGEPYDLNLYAWGADYTDPTGFLIPILAPEGVSGLNLDDPLLARRLDAANRLRGDARLAALTRLEVELMRDNPPLASFGHVAQRVLLSRSVGCVVFHPVYFGPNLTTVCKER